MIKEPRITIFTGHFGSGKTELAINLAFAEKESKEMVAIADLDVINPYYRTRDVAELFHEKGVELIAPKGKMASADLPIVSGEIYRVIHDERYRLLIDAGGDKDGAMALGQYYNEWHEWKPEMIFVVNTNRPYVSTIEGIMDTVDRIEKASRLRVTGLINNSNVGAETSMDEISRGLELCNEVACRLNLPVLYTTISSQLREETQSFASENRVKYINRFMKLPWEA